MSKTKGVNTETGEYLATSDDVQEVGSNIKSMQELIQQMKSAGLKTSETEKELQALTDELEKNSRLSHLLKSETDILSQIDTSAKETDNKDVTKILSSITDLISNQANLSNNELKVQKDFFKTLTESVSTNTSIAEKERASLIQIINNTQDRTDKLIQINDKYVSHSFVDTAKAGTKAGIKSLGSSVGSGISSAGSMVGGALAQEAPLLAMLGKGALGLGKGAFNVGKSVYKGVTNKESSKDEISRFESIQKEQEQLKALSANFNVETKSENLSSLTTTNSDSKNNTETVTLTSANIQILSSISTTAENSYMELQKLSNILTSGSTETNNVLSSLATNMETSNSLMSDSIAANEIAGIRDKEQVGNSSGVTIPKEEKKSKSLVDILTKGLMGIFTLGIGKLVTSMSGVFGGLLGSLKSLVFGKGATNIGTPGLGNSVGQGASKVGKAAGMLGGAMKFAKFLGPAAAVAGLGYGAYEGVQQTGEIFGKKQEDTTTGEKISAGIGGAVDSLTFGLLDTKTVALATQALGEGIANTVTELGDSISSVFTGAVTFVSNIGTNIYESITGIGTSITDTITGIGSSISSVFTDSISFITDIGTNIYETVAGIGDSISSVFSNMFNIDFITNIGSNVLSSITGFGSSIVQSFSDTFSSLTNGLGGIISSVVSSIPGGSWIMEKMGFGSDSVTNTSNESSTVESGSKEAEMLEVQKQLKEQSIMSTLDSIAGLTPVGMLYNALGFGDSADSGYSDSNTTETTNISNSGSSVNAGNIDKSTMDSVSGIVTTTNSTNSTNSTTSAKSTKRTNINKDNQLSTTSSLAVSDAEMESNLKASKDMLVQNLMQAGYTQEQAVQIANEQIQASTNTVGSDVGNGTTNSTNIANNITGSSTETSNAIKPQSINSVNTFGIKKEKDTALIASSNNLRDTQLNTDTVSTKEKSAGNNTAINNVQNIVNNYINGSKQRNTAQVI